MEKDAFLSQVADKAQCDLDTTSKLYDAIVEVLAEALSRGEGVNLTPEFASFRVKRSDNPGRNEGSPRAPSASHYTVRFKTGAALEKRLKIHELNL